MIAPVLADANVIDLFYVAASSALLIRPLVHYGEEQLYPYLYGGRPYR